MEVLLLDNLYTSFTAIGISFSKTAVQFHIAYHSSVGVFFIFYFLLLFYFVKAIFLFTRKVDPCFYPFVVPFMSFGVKFPTISRTSTCSLQIS